MSDHDRYGPDEYGPDEAFEEPERRISGGARMAVVAAVVVGLAAAGGIAWFAYQQGLKQAGSEPVPMIKAEDAPIKHRPEEPGGMNVPHQDKLVFNRLAPGQVENQVERLLPPPEEPVAKPEPTAPAVQTPPAEAGAASARSTAEASGSVTGPGVEAAPRDPVTVDPPPVPEAPASAVRESAPPEPAAAPSAPATTPRESETEVAAAPPPAPAPEAKPAAAAGGAWRIQLASVSSREGATTEWSRMQKRNEALLGPLDLNVQVAQLSKGTFYRIQAGPLADRSSAEDLCAKLKSRKQDCLVVAP